MKWITEGFQGFSKGTMENGGQNLYVSRAGVLQRIFQYDVNGDGYPELPFSNSQSMNERPPVHVYRDLLHNPSFDVLPAGGTFDGLLEDLTGNGYDDLVLACQHNGTHSDIPAVIYFGSSEGLTEDYRIELPAPSSVGVCAGDFNGTGRKDLVFLSNGQLRIFYQEERGFCPAIFTDIPLEATSAAAADLDGDGYCDLLFKDSQGRVGVLFGGEDGLKLERITWLQGEKPTKQVESSSTTPGLFDMDFTWKPNILTLNGIQYLFCVREGWPVLYTCGNDRAITPAMSFPCEHVIAAAAGDLSGDGYDDLVFAVFTGKEATSDCRIYLGSSDGFSEERMMQIPITAAVRPTIADLDGAALIMCRSSEILEMETQSPVLRIHNDGTWEKIAEVTGGDCGRILAGYPAGQQSGCQVIVLNHKMTRARGKENIYLYLGGEDGYLPDRRLELPGRSSVDTAMCDFSDNGFPDVLVCNCSEDAPDEDEGCYLYVNDGSGVHPEKRIKIPTVRAHGMAIGDFRKSGYLDIAFGGFLNRELRIFHGSEHGYSLDHCTRILLGAQDEGYEPRIPKKDEVIWELMNDPSLSEYGQIRWLLAADFNCDGWPDLFISEITGSRCYILWGGPEGFSWDRKTELLSDGVGSATVADLNGNGWPDLILSAHQSKGKHNVYESYLTIYWGGPDGYQENRKMQLPVCCANSVTVGDYNGNGSLDIYATAYKDGRTRDLVSYLYPGKDGHYSTRDVHYLFNHSGSGCLSADLNGDGYTDLVVACHKEYGDHCGKSYIFWGGPDGLSDDRKTELPTIGPHNMATIDPGNILNRGDREHYTSEAYRLPADAVVSSIHWDGHCTSSSWVELEMRAAEEEDALKHTAWIPVQADTDLTEMKLRGVIQYRIALCAKCACGTPRITSVAVHYKTN